MIRHLEGKYQKPLLSFSKISFLFLCFQKNKMYPMCLQNHVKNTPDLIKFSQNYTNSFFFFKTKLSLKSNELLQ